MGANYNWHAVANYNWNAGANYNCNVDANHNWQWAGRIAIGRLDAWIFSHVCVVVVAAAKNVVAGKNLPYRIGDVFKNPPQGR